MRITRLQLADFKRHASLEIKPAPGLTVIRGPNEAGKSTIAQAIELVLFRKADANREDVRQAWAWGATDPPQVMLDLEIDGQNARLAKRFDGSRATAELILDGRSSDDHAFIQERIAAITGIPSEAFFRSTAFVGHSELDAVDGDEPALQDRLQRAVSGADRGTAKAKKKLETAVHRYRTEGQKNPGLLKVTRAEIALLEGELATGEAALTRLQADRAQWVEAHERRQDLDTQLRVQQADLAEAQRAEALAQRRDAANERYERLKRAAALVEEEERLQQAMPRGVSLAQLRTATARAKSLQFEISELEADLSIAAEAGTADIDPEMTPPRPLRWLVLAAVLVALGWLTSFVLGDSGLLGVVAVVGLAVGVVASLVLAIRGAARRRQYGLAMHLAATATTQRAEADRAQQEQLHRQQRELEATLATIGVADVDTAEELLASLQTHTEALAQVEGELRGLGVEERSLRRLSEARDEAAGEAERMGHALATMGRLADDPSAARRAAERAVAQTLPARDAARSEEDQAQGRVDANTVDADVVAGLAERLSAARERYAELERRLLVYQGTLQAIEAAERATLKTAARYLEEHMGPTIASITDGRYDDIEIDERSLAFRVRAPETGEMVAVASLSQGTADQLFLAARLGLVRLVTMDRRPPLVLDDPFVTFDTARGERALRLVKQFATAHGFQVLFLTCSDRFDRLADELIVLPGPSTERVLAMPRQAGSEPAATSPSSAAIVAPSPRTAEVPQPTLRFEPDPRPNPDPVAPRRPTAIEDDRPDPLAALRRAASQAPEDEESEGPG